jgi:hypothetical protein
MTDESDDYPTALHLCGEDWLEALLLQMVLHHCATANPDELDSYGIKANADAMNELEGLIEITANYPVGTFPRPPTLPKDRLTAANVGLAAAPRILAKVLPEGRAVIERLRIEQQKDAERSQS